MTRLRSIHIRLTVTSLVLTTMAIFCATTTVAFVNHKMVDSTQQVSTTVQPVSTKTSKPTETVPAVSATPPTTAASTPTTISTPSSSTTKPVASKPAPVATTVDNGLYGPLCLAIQNTEYIASNGRVQAMLTEHKTNLVTLKQAYDNGEYDNDYYPDYASPYDEYQADISNENQRWSDAAYASSQQIVTAMHAAGCAYN